MSHGSGAEAYERAVYDLLDALARTENPQVSNPERQAAHRWAVEAALAARHAALAIQEEEEEIDLWVPPHLRPPETSRDYRLSDAIGRPGWSQNAPHLPMQDVT